MVQPVSYTHLDVYKRQDKNLADKKLEEENIQKKETEKIKLQDSLNN